MIRAGDEVNEISEERAMFCTYILILSRVDKAQCQQSAFFQLGRCSVERDEHSYHSLANLLQRRCNVALIDRFTTNIGVEYYAHIP